MANELIKKNYKDIADAIRSKTGENGLMTAEEMPAKIESIQTGIEPTGTIEITTNGEHDVAQYGTANVNVPNPSTGTLTITENGTYDVTTKASAEVNVPGPTGTASLLYALSDYKTDYGWTKAVNVSQYKYLRLDGLKALVGDNTPSNNNKLRGFYEKSLQDFYLGLQEYYPERGIEDVPKIYSEGWSNDFRYYSTISYPQDNPLEEKYNYYAHIGLHLKEGEDSQVAYADFHDSSSYVTVTWGDTSEVDWMPKIKSNGYDYRFLYLDAWTIGRIALEIYFNEDEYTPTINCVGCENITEYEARGLLAEKNANEFLIFTANGAEYRKPFKLVGNFKEGGSGSGSGSGE